MGRAPPSAVQAECGDRVVREIRDEAALYLGKGPRRRVERCEVQYQRTVAVVHKVLYSHPKLPSPTKMTIPRRWATGAVCALAVAVLLGQATRAQTRRPMSLVDIAELQRLLSPRLSPDGRTLAYMLNRPDWKLGRTVSHLWRQDLNGAPVQLTFSEGGDQPFPRSVRWSPDGKTLLFFRAGQVWVMPADGGEPHAVTHHATLPASAAWSPDGSTIYFIASDPATVEDRERDRLRDDVFAFEENYKQRQ